MTEDRNMLDEQGQARRRFLKQAATVAWASPFIVTMMSRTAHAQQQCGTTALAADPPFAIFCNVTQPCGTAIPCVPAPGATGAGDPCICASP